MIMSANHQSYVVGTNGIGYIVPIVHISFRQRVMGYENHRLVFAPFVHFLFQPGYVLRHNVSVSHTHERSGVETEKKYSVVLEFKSLAAENFTECHAAAVAPAGFVIAEYDVVFILQQIKTTLHFFNGFPVSVVGYVACNENEVQTVCGVNLCHRAQQAFRGIGIVRIQVYVGDLCKTKRTYLRVERA